VGVTTGVLNEPHLPLPPLALRPLGYDRRVKQPIARILVYRIRYLQWRVEDALFQRWGVEMRKRWIESLTPPRTHRKLTPHEY
jgi:hypothetical protein